MRFENNFPTSLIINTVNIRDRKGRLTQGDKSHNVNWPFLLQNLVAETNSGPSN